MRACVCVRVVCEARAGGSSGGGHYTKEKASQRSSSSSSECHIGVINNFNGPRQFVLSNF